MLRVPIIARTIHQISKFNIEKFGEGFRSRKYVQKVSHLSHFEKMRLRPKCLKKIAGDALEYPYDG
jgi:hypothetical protein